MNPLDYMDHHFERVGNRLVVGYIVDDPDPENPLTDMDGNGEIYTARRFSQTLSDYNDALGLHDGSPNLNKVTSEHPERFGKLWIAAAADNEEFHVWCQKNGRPPKTDDSDVLRRYYLNKARRFWNDTEGVEPFIRFDENVWSFNFTDDVELGLWRMLRQEGQIGDPDAVSLDVYEHSGVMYSVSGHGMQCQFDTAQSGAVWVPEDEARAEIDRRAPVYQFGEIQSFRSGGVERFKFVIDNTGIESAEFTNWGDCFAEARKMTDGMRSDNTSLGRRRAAVELAESACEIYTDFVNGSVYGVVIEVHERVDGADKETELTDDSDVAVFGFYGSNTAEDELRHEFHAAVKHEKEKIAENVQH
jgi:hypothetical protein